VSLNRYAKRRDANEKQIVDALQAVGASVVRLDKPLDLLVGINGRCYIIEVKTEKGRLTKDQKKFIALWRGQYAIVTNVDEAIEAILK
jgi:Holliday junction resolvase